jgi:hypothetical protein
LLGFFVPAGDRGGDIAGIDPGVNLFSTRFGIDGFHLSHYLGHDLGREILEVVLRKVRHID